MKPSRVIILDIDGVLNAHEWCHGFRGTKINSERVAILRETIDQLRAIDSSPIECVLCSSWRDKIASGAMSLAGFAWMLSTHGLDVPLIGVTPPGKPEDRGDQVMQWVAAHEPAQWIVIDDLELRGVPRERHVRPHPSIGLEWRHVSEIKQKLGSLRGVSSNLRTVG